MNQHKVYMEAIRDAKQVGGAKCPMNKEELEAQVEWDCKHLVTTAKFISCIGKIDFKKDAPDWLAQKFMYAKPHTVKIGESYA